MQAFKLYFKIYKKTALISTLIFIAVFVVITILFSYNSTSTSGFELKKCKVAVIDEDNSVLSKELTKYLSKNTESVSLKNNENSFKDALFFQEVDYIAKIPKGFGKQFQTNDVNLIETMQLPNGTNAMLVKNIIDSYLLTVKLYYDGTGKIDFEKVNKDLSISTNVNLLGKNTSVIKSSEARYVNYLTYPLLGILISVIPTVMLILNGKEVKRRNYASPVKTNNFTWQMLFGNFISMLGVFTVFVALGLIMYGDALLSTKGLLWGLTSLLFAIFSLCLSTFISTFATKNAIPAISNCISLSCCFLGGAFVPQELLSESVLKFAVINPAYWFIKANNTIYELNTYNAETLKPVFLSIVILLAFSCAFIAMTLVISKAKVRSN